MTQQKTVPIARFEAFDDSGRRYSIIGNQKMIAGPASSPSGQPAWTPGPLTLRTVDGQSVNRLSKGTYEVQAEKPIRVTSTDPHAP